MERFLFKKIELWVVLLIMVLGFVLLIFFGAAVRNETKGFNKFGVAGRAANYLAELPSTARRISQNKWGLVAFGGQRFEGLSGWAVADTEANLPGYLLLSRFDGTAQNHVVELIDLSTFEAIHQWWPNSETLLEGVELDEKYITSADLVTSRFRAIHPVLLENGDLIIKDHQAPVMRVNACAGLIWREAGELYHHSSAIGPDGHLWISSHLEPVTVDGVPEDYRDNSIVQMTLDGDILFSKSVTQILIDEGYRNRLFNPFDYISDPVHVNDIEPVMEEGPYWKKGDVFISMRHISAVMLYRPSTDEVIWYNDALWSGQHDVDIVDDHTIAVFNNNAYDMGKGGVVVGNNEIVYYDFDTQKDARPYQEAFDREEIRTMSEGLFDLLPDGSAMVEEENFGRLLIIGADGTKHGEFVNRATNERVYRLGWSRYIDQALGDQAREALADVDCN